MALNLSCQGKFEAALEQARLALQLDPYHTWARWILAESQFFCGLYEDVLATIADTGNPPASFKSTRSQPMSGSAAWTWRTTR